MIHEEEEGLKLGANKPLTCFYRSQFQTKGGIGPKTNRENKPLTSTHVSRFDLTFLLSPHQGRFILCTQGSGECGRYSCVKDQCDFVQGNGGDQVPDRPVCHGAELRIDDVPAKPGHIGLAETGISVNAATHVMSLSAELS